MASSSPKRSPTPERIASEDPDTAAARKELRHTAISEKPDLDAMATTNTNHTARPNDAQTDDNASGEDTTPECEAGEDAAAATKEQMASPKKKRAHDEVDEPKDATADRDVSPIGADGSTSLNRTDRSEPEKKRLRDVSSESHTDPTSTNVWTITPLPLDKFLANSSKHRLH
jgi:Ran-binding protein 3